MITLLQFATAVAMQTKDILSRPDSRDRHIQEVSSAVVKLMWEKGLSLRQQRSLLDELIALGDERTKAAILADLVPHNGHPSHETTERTKEAVRSLAVLILEKDQFSADEMIEFLRGHAEKLVA